MGVTPDADGRTIAVGDEMIVAGTVRRIEPGDGVVVVVTPDGRSYRCTADQLLRVEDLVTRGNAGESPGRFFHTNPPASSVAASGLNDLIRKTDLNADQTTQNALFLGILGGYATGASVVAGYQPLDSDLTAIAALDTTALGRSILAATDVAGLSSITSSPYVLAQESAGSATGASSTAWHDVLTLTIPASALGTTGRLAVDCSVLYTVASGNTAGRFLVDGVVVWNASGGAMTAGTGTPFWAEFKIWLAANGSEAAQRGGFHVQIADDRTASADTGTAYGGWSFGQNRGAGGFAASTADSSASLTFTFQTKFSTSSSGNSFARQSSCATIYPTP